MTNTPPPTAERRTQPPNPVVLLGNIAASLFVHDTPERIAHEVFDRLAAHLDLDLLITYLLSDDGTRLHLAAFAGMDEYRARLIETLGFNQAVCGTAAARREPVVAEHVQASSDPMTEFARALGVRTYACYPLMAAHGQLVGTVSFGSRCRDTFAGAELELMQAVANQLAGAIERTRVLSRLERELRERGQAEEARRRSDAALEGEHEFLRTIVDSVSSMVVVRDENGRCLLANHAAARFHGLSSRALEGADCRALATMPAEVLALDREVLRTGKETVNEMEVVGGDGLRHFLMASRTPLTNHDGVRDRVLVTSVDLTWLKRAEHERNRAEEALRAANERLSESDRRKEEFLSVLSHELRNPLAPIRYALPLLQRGGLDEAAERAVAVIGRQVEHLTRLVDDLLEVSRISQGRIELRREHVTIGSVVDAAVEAAWPSISAARHTLSIDGTEEPIWLQADPARLAQVITNLLNNSAKYTPRGGRIVLENSREGNEAVIRVRDNGAGIPPEALGTVFEMYRQVHRAGTPQEGLGIGLALVKRLVEMHGGTITAHSAGLGQGAEFVVRLPIAHEGRAKEAGEPGSQSVQRPLKVLVVDDNADLVEMLGLVVSRLGHDVRKALDGRSAISAALSYRPDVVLLDLGLPVVDGLEVARELRRHPEVAGARLVAMTGWGQAEDRHRTEEAGFDHHLTKPTEPRELERLLSQMSGTDR